MRGRNNNSNNSGNRKSPNPLQRSYESNGPDVKVRGTAQHVAEKYLQLARDAQSSGDTIAAESYFQYAEHYYRILLAAQEQMTQQFGHTFPPNRAFVDDIDEGDDDGEEEGAFQPGGPQGQRAEGEAGEGQNGHPHRFERPRQQGGQERFDNRQDRGGDRNGNQGRRFDNRQERDNRQDRGERRFERGETLQPTGFVPRPEAPRSEIPVHGETQEAAQEAQAQSHVAQAHVPAPAEPRFDDRPARLPRPERRPRRERVESVEAAENGDDTVAALPSFVTMPVRVPTVSPVAEPAPEPAGDGGDGADTAEAAPKRTRRRRSPREVMDALGSEVDSE